MDRARKYYAWTAVVFLVLSSVFLYLHLFRLPGTPIYIEEDHLNAIHDAWRMYNGEALYRDFFQFTFPGTPVFYFILLRLFGVSFWIVNAVIFFQGIAQAGIWLAISKTLFGPRYVSFLPSALFLFLGFRWFGVDGSHRMLSPVFVGLAILALLKLSGKMRVITAAACAALASFFTQQRGILVIGAIGLFLLVEALRESPKTDWKRLLAAESILIGAFIAILTLLLLPFVISAGPTTFFNDTVGYLQYYVQAPDHNNYSSIGRDIAAVMGQGIFLPVLTFFYYAVLPLTYISAFVYFWRRKYDAGTFLITLVGSFLLVGTFAPTPARMFQIALPALAVFVWLLSRSIKRFDRIAVIAVGLLVVVGISLATRLQTHWDYRYLDSPSGRLAFASDLPYERFRWLAEHTTPGDYVFEAYQPTVNFALQVHDPTRVPFVLDSGYTPEWQIQQVIDDLRKERPKFIIWDGKWSKPEGARAPGDRLAPLYDLLRQDYEMIQEFTPYSNREMQAWGRRSGS